MTDAELVRAAGRAAGFDLTVTSARQAFASVLGVYDRTLRFWLDGRSMDRSPTARLVCRAIVARPGLAGELARAGG